MRAHIIEAAEQCGRTALADIDEPVKLDAFLKQRDEARTLYFADETGGEPAATAFQPGPALILTGPEGGFTPDEAAADPRRTQFESDQPRPPHPSRGNRRAGCRRGMDVGRWRLAISSLLRS